MAIVHYFKGGAPNSDRGPVSQYPRYAPSPATTPTRIRDEDHGYIYTPSRRVDFCCCGFQDALGAAKPTVDCPTIEVGDEVGIMLLNTRDYIFDGTYYKVCGGVDGYQFGLKYYEPDGTDAGIELTSAGYPVIAAVDAAPTPDPDGPFDPADWQCKRIPFSEFCGPVCGGPGACGWIPAAPSVACGGPLYIRLVVEAVPTVDPAECNPCCPVIDFGFHLRKGAVNLDPSCTAGDAFGAAVDYGTHGAQV